MSAPGRTSLIDVVDDYDEAIGRIARSQALEVGVGFRTTHIFLLNSQGELLLQRLSVARQRHPGRWGSSVAAYLNSGESYVQAARRRLGEELGLALALRPLGKLEMQDENSLKFVTLFLAIDGQAAIHEPDHIEEIAYWPQDRLQATLDETPDEFTPTFRELYRAFGARLR